MRHWGLNILCILVAVLSGVGMFLLKYRVIEYEEDLFRLHRQIAADKREIHMLKGDWAALNDPERLRVLVEKQTNFKHFKSSQVLDSDKVSDISKKEKDKKKKGK